MMKAIRSSAFMPYDWPPASFATCSDAVMVCSVDLYDFGRDNNINMLK